VGLVVAPGRFHAGTVHVADIGLDLDETATRLATVELLRSVPRRSEGDNKYTAGHVLVVGGSRGFTGAPCLSALAAMRADAGYVTVAAPQSTLPVFEQRLLEAVKRPLPDDAGLVAVRSADVVLELAAKASALALGPGLGRGQGPQELVRRLLAELELPIVVDADALFELEPADWAGPRVLTPHEGELARLLGRTSGEIAAHRLASVQEAVERFGCVVVLKGPDTLVAAPDRGLIVCALGLPSLATAGTGDVLTGIVSAFLAKGMDPQLAAAAAVVAQQRASVEAPQRSGLVRRRSDRRPTAGARIDAPLRVDDRPRCPASQRAHAPGRTRRRGALGGGEGQRIWPRGNTRCRRGPRHRCNRVVRRDHSGRARSAQGVLDGADPRHGPGGEQPRGRAGA